MDTLVSNSGPPAEPVWWVVLDRQSRKVLGWVKSQLWFGARQRAVTLCHREPHEMVVIRAEPERAELIAA